MPAGNSHRCALLLSLCLFSGLAYSHVPVDDQIARVTAQIQQKPRDGSLYLRRGDLYRSRGEPAKARDDYLHASRIDPALAGVELRLGILSLEAGEFQRARSSFDRYLRKQPNDAVGLRMRARALQALGMPAAAAVDFRRAIAALQPPSQARPEDYLDWARALEAAGGRHREEAIEALEEGMRALGPIVSLQFPAIDLDLRLGRFDSALRRMAMLEARDTHEAALGAVESIQEVKQRRPAAVSLQAPEEILVQFGSPARYRANSSDAGLGLTWTQAAFDDSLWAQGSYGVGYEQNPPGASALIQSPVSPGAFSVYSRASFNLLDITQIVGMSIAADYDDGYVAWINGVEVFRSPEMPAGGPVWNTNASLHESSNGAVPNYGSAHDITAAALPVLYNGVNVLAIGVWNSGAPTSSDLVLVPRLSFHTSATVIRGPYLQMGTPQSMVVQWRTDAASNSCVRYGTQAGSLGSLACDPAVTTEHAVTVAGLSPDTRYYYSVGTTDAPLAGGDTNYFFDTSPASGSAIPARLWVLGDSGTADTNAAAVRNAYTTFNAGARTNLMLMLGDNAYPDGTDAQFQAAVFDMYPEYLRNTVLWPTLGNHDGASADSATQTGAYYDIFTLPKAGEAGGLASGTEAYFSFDYGNIHFICLESFETDRSPTSAMMTWLQQDVLATSRQWVIAFWHHPPYTKGSHDSDAEPELVDMRQNALPILEQAGVDLVLTGHSHSYERSFLIDGHYGLSAIFSSAMVVNGGDGKVGGSGPYLKAALQPASHEGTVYVVAGSSGQTSGGTLDHPAMFVSLSRLGSLVLDVNGRRLDARFLQSTGLVSDLFTLFKGPPPQAAFASDVTSGTAPLTVAFADVSLDDPTAWAWDFNGDAVSDSAAQSPSHVYATAGIYTVSLTASNLAGADTESKPALICVTSANGLADVDGDGVADGGDLCPCTADPLQENTDGDGLGNACDPDDDNDGAADTTDCAPLDATHSAPPGEVGMSIVVGPALGDIAWAAVPQATLYNVYRGLIAAGVGFSYNHTCHESHSPDTASADPASPVLNAAYYYLTSAGNSCAEGPLGFDSLGSQRPNLFPCP